jgi:C-terminal processing protease CtpA/Prc
VVLSAASELQAQTVTVRSAPRVMLRSAGAPTGPNACAELMAQPSALLDAPEGFALLRFKRELEGAALALEMSQQMEREQLQRFSQLQRQTDSLVRVVIERKADGSEQRTMTVRMLAPDIPSLIRDLQPQVAALASEAEARVMGNHAGGAGYVGISLSGVQLRVVTPDGVMTSHCEYPMVETVDVGSPAARAGLSAGDTLVSYNGRDLTRLAINYPAMLLPGETVRMRVVKSGKAREVTVTVAPRMVEEPVRGMIFLRSPQGGPPGPQVVGPGAPPQLSGSYALSTASAMLAGAQFSNVDEEFAQTLGLEKGVLVMRVAPGSPAAEAGLRAGEVLRSVNGTAVRDVNTLRRLLQTSGPRPQLQLQSPATGTRVVVLVLR